MVKIIFYSVIASLLMTACSDNANKTPFYRKPMTVVIHKNAAWDGYIKTDETAEKCRDFTLPVGAVREYFQVAQAVTEQGYAQDQILSRCFAEGELTLPGKHKAKWRIDRARRGILMVEDDQSYFFYCADCVGRMYAERR